MASPKILSGHFKSGLVFQEIINGHRLQNFEDKVDIHMLRGDNDTGCSRFSLDDVKNETL